MKIPSRKPLGVNAFFVWLMWLQDLGGEYQYLGPDPTAPQEMPKKTGRRDPDRKPRTYSLNGRLYDVDKRGVVTKYETKYLKWGLRPA